MQLNWSRWRRRAPLASLSASFVLLLVILAAWVLGATFLSNPAVLANIALGFVVLLFWDSLRLTRSADGLNRLNKSEQLENEPSLAQEELLEFFEQREQQLLERKVRLDERDLQLQQQLQLAAAQDIFDGTKRQALSHFTSSDSDMSRTEIAEYQDSDRDLLKLIEATTKELFGHIKSNRYTTPDNQSGKVGGLRTDLMRNDAIQLATAVARIYRPDDTEPLLHTNADSILRATSRAALQVLVTIENLPIPGGVQHLSIASIYPRVKQAVDSYALYQDAKPYLDHASTLFFVGRWALGANPLTLAAWWGISRAATYGAKQLGEHYINQQMLGVIRQAVEGIAIEVASLYSPSLRFRDANWIYGVELVELVHQLNLDADTRLKAIEEIAKLKMPDEFGRMLLMRWLALRTSPKPEQYRASELLDVETRQLIAERVEQFLTQNHIVRTESERHLIDTWMSGVSERLGIQLKTSSDVIDTKVASEIALSSLASFAVEFLEVEPAELYSRLRESRTLKNWLQAAEECDPENASSEENAPNAEEFLINSSYEFQPPATLLSEEQSDDYFSDLSELAVEHAISTSRKNARRLSCGVDAMPVLEGARAIRLAAHWSRADVKEKVGLFQSQLSQAVAESIENSQPTDLPFGLAHALLRVGEAGAINFVFAGVRAESSVERPYDELYLVSVSDQLSVIALSRSPQEALVEFDIVALGNRSECQVAPLAGMVRKDYRVTFPAAEDGKALQFVVAGKSFRTTDSYFACLLGDT